MPTPTPEAVLEHLADSGDETTRTLAAELLHLRRAFRLLRGILGVAYPRNWERAFRLVVETIGED